MTVSPGCSPLSISFLMSRRIDINTFLISLKLRFMPTFDCMPKSDGIVKFLDIVAIQLWWQRCQYELCMYVPSKMLYDGIRMPSS